MAVDQLAEWASSAGQPAPLRSRRYVLMTRGLDLVLALTLLALLFPLLLAIAIAVRLDSPGMPIYRQRRIGLGGREFLVNKFRSMRCDAEATQHRAYVKALIGRSSEEAPTGEGTGLYKLVVDDRITRVGRVLRRYSLDELPQLWNVVRGDMCLVGPRPVIPYEAECYPAWYHERFSVKPGLTGLWQVSGRNERTYEEMVMLDIEYSRAKSLWLDIEILLRTAWVVLTGRGAA
jgi:lipopolysaccharide/colanic/teichoic acid biosynthesis glycosyltransferase